MSISGTNSSGSTQSTRACTSIAIATTTTTTTTTTASSARLLLLWLTGIVGKQRQMSTKQPQWRRYSTCVAFVLTYVVNFCHVPVWRVTLAVPHHLVVQLLQ